MAPSRWPAMVALLLAGAGAWGATRLEAHLAPSALLDVDAPDRLVYVLPLDEGLNDDAVSRIHALSTALASLPAVERVDSLTATPLPHAREGGGDLDATLSLLEAHPEAFTDGLGGLGARVGGELTVAPIAATRALSDEQREAVRRAARYAEGALVDAGQTRTLVVARGALELAHAARLASAHNAQLTGRAVLEADLAEQLRVASPLMALVAGFLTLLILVGAIRTAAGVMLPMLAAGATLGIVMGGYGWFGRPVTLLTAIVPPVLLTIIIGDSIHLVHRFFEERRGGASPPVAAMNARRHMLRACLATTLTTAAGFAGLLLAGAPAVREFAVLSIVGILVGLVVVLGVVPPGLARSHAIGPRAEALGAVLAAIATSTARRRTAVLVACAVLLAVCGTARVGTDSRLLSPFDDADAGAELARSLEDGLSGFRQMRLTVRGPTERRDAIVRDLSRSLTRDPGVLQVRSTTQILDRLWSTLSDAAHPEDAATRAALVRLAGPALAELEFEERSVIEVALVDLPARRILGLAAEARALGASAVSGEAVETSRAIHEVHRELSVGFAGAALSVLVVLLLVFGPRAVGAITLPNALPLAIVWGFMSLRSIPFDVATAMVFAVALGLVVDGTIHLTARHRELMRGGMSHADATRDAYRHAGVPMLVSALTLLAGFSALFVGGLLPMNRFAELASIAIVAGVLAELCVLPALLPRVR